MDDIAERPIVFLDFDGTISRVDVVDAILERYALDGWREIEQRWQSGRIGSRECLRDQMALVRAAPCELEALVDAIGTDPGIIHLLEVCREHAIDMHIVSDGFDLCIDRLLSATDARLAHIPVCSSHLEWIPSNRWGASFPFDATDCEHGCATCKPSVMGRMNPQGRPVLFVGDGLSDRFACDAADVVFAKDRLRAHCAERGLAHVCYDRLEEVASFIERAMRLRQRWRQPLAVQAGA